MEKTNVMRLLDAAKIPYGSYEYAAPDGALSGVEVARQLGQEEERVFKTLVTQAASGKYYVFVIPVGEELNLKKAASAVHEKKIEMIKSKELLPLTGYIHGGCSPIGMKKPFPTASPAYQPDNIVRLNGMGDYTVVDETAQLWDTIIFSAGKIGYQVEVSPENLGKIISYTFADVTQG